MRSAWTAAEIESPFPSASEMKNQRWEEMFGKISNQNNIEMNHVHGRHV